MRTRNEIFLSLITRLREGSKPLSDEQLDSMVSRILLPTMTKLTYDPLRIHLLFVTWKYDKCRFERLVGCDVRQRFLEDILKAILSGDETLERFFPYLMPHLAVVPLDYWVNHVTHRLLRVLEAQSCSDFIRAIRQGLHRRAGEQNDYGLMLEFLAE